MVLDDELVSRHHCRVTVDGDRAAVEDLGSLNGTFVNGMQIHGSVLLHPGDQILMGTTVLQLRTAADITVQRSVAVPVPPALAAPARRPDYVPARLVVDAGSQELEDLLDTTTKRKARVAPLGIFVLVVLALLILLAFRSP